MSTPALKEVLDGYIELGNTAGFPAWAEGMGWRVVRRNGYWLAYRDGRAAPVAFAAVHVPGAVHRKLSTIPCVTCGSLATGEYPNGRTPDDRRSYSCEPHQPIYPEPAA